MIRPRWSVQSSALVMSLRASRSPGSERIALFQCPRVIPCCSITLPPVGSFPKNSALAKTVLFGVRSHRRFPKSWLANDVSGPVDSEKKRAK